MKTLNLYVARAFLTTFAMSIVVLTFAMLGGRLVQVIDKLAEGIPFSSFLWFVAYTMPVVLCFTVPLAVMVAVVMVFGRLSADSEITAMRACGISIIQIVSPILLLTFFLTGLCCWLQLEVGPPALEKARRTISNALIDKPLALFTPGKQVVFDTNKIIYIDNKSGDNELRGVQIFEVEQASRTEVNIRRDISAATGYLRVDEEAKILTVELHNCTITDRAGATGKSTVMLDSLSIDVDYGKEMNAVKLGKRPKFMTTAELLAFIRLNIELDQPTVEMEIELNQRIAFGLSPIAFLLFGLPLAIQTSRRETSIGLFLSVILAGGFFLSVTICESLGSYPRLYPQYLLWLPTLIYQIGGSVMIYRISRR